MFIFSVRKDNHKLRYLKYLKKSLYYWRYLKINHDHANMF